MTPSEANLVTRSSSSGRLDRAVHVLEEEDRRQPEDHAEREGALQVLLHRDVEAPRRKLRVIDPVDVRRRRAAQARRDLGLVLPLLELIEQRLLRHRACG